MSQLEQKTQHVAKMKEKLAEQKKLLAHYEQRYPHAPQFANEQRQCVGITQHHLEDAQLDLQKTEQENFL